MDAIDALKQKVLTLAIQGKLVPQNPSDEPASVLLEKIKIEKEALVKAGKIKKDKQESFIFRGEDNKYYEKIGTEIRDITNEIPFDIPENWMFIRLPMICNLIKGKEVNGCKLPYLDVKYLRGKKEKKYISKGYILNKDDFVILVDGENSGEVFKIPEEGIMGSTFRQLLINFNIYENYILHVLKYYQTLLRLNKRGAAIPHIDKEVFNNLLIGLPPLYEQKKISNKIEKIFSQIEVVKSNQEELVKLKTGLKSKILDLAIQGKLVEQNPDDEPASVLLERIKAEKVELVKQGKIKKDKQESYIYKTPDNRHYEKVGSETKDITGEIPFEIPENWVWCRLKEITTSISDGSHNPPKGVSDSKFFMLSSKNIINDKINFDNPRYLSEEDFRQENKRTDIQIDDILLTIVGSIGRCAKVNFENKITIQRSIAVIKASLLPLHLDFIVLLLQSYTKYFEDVAKGTAQLGVYLNTLSSTLLPLPPLNEQKRIAVKVKVLYSLVQRL